MEELRKLVKKLEQEYGDKKQIEILQEIGKKLINEYEIQIGKFTIEPLLVEAYYYAIEDKKFADCSVHAAGSETSNTANLARARQKNNFGELYVHYGIKSSDGIDVVLSCGDYYLSYLIKNALVDGKFATQLAVPETLCKGCDGREVCDGGFKCKYYGEKILKKVENRKKEIVCIPRKGTNGSYGYAPLGLLAIYALANEEQSIGVSSSLAGGKQWVIAKYALEKNNQDEEKARKFIMQEGLYDSRVDDDAFTKSEKYKDFLIDNGWE